ncbi:hypothetical protein LQW54_001359 [Pestalotiopsis sp. IQ-011]
MASNTQSSTVAEKGPKGHDEITLQQKYEQLQERYMKLLEDRVEELSRKTEIKSISSRRDSTVTYAGDEVTGPEVSTVSEIGNDSSNAAKIQYRMDTFDEKGMPIQEPYDPTQINQSKLQASGTTAATLIYYFDRRKIQMGTELKVESDEVKSILQKHLKHYPRFHWEIPNLRIFAPFEPLIHNWEALTKAVADNPDDKGHQDLAAILEAVKASKDVKEYFESESDYAGEKEVLFNFLWTIFPPGELVVMTNGFMKKHPQLFVVRGVSMIRHPGQKKAVNLKCWSYDWDGTRRTFNRACVDIRIDFFKGQRRITTLPCYPLKYYEDGDTGKLEKLKLKLVKRGMLFHDLCIRKRGDQLFEYDGSAYLRGTGVRHVDPQFGSNTDDSDDESTINTLMNMKGRVMVDFESYSRHGPDGPIPMGDLMLRPFNEDDECGCDKCKEKGGPFENQRSLWDGAKEITKSKLPKGVISDEELRQFIAEEGLEQEELERFMVCAPRVLGYHLMEKKWIEMFVDDVQEVDHGSSRKAFEKVQLAENQKKLIQELVQSHSNDKDVNRNTPRSKMNDLTKGKGEGLVILLHGPPGVGKTLTAESVAQVTRKPLFPMGVGDVTTDPVQLERRLEQMFELAEVWHAVMLFDEADVFLESRASAADVTRVGLVSAIFENLLGQLTDDYLEDKRGIINWFKEDEEAYKWCERLNGRQIRNVVFSAASLAGIREDKKLTLKEIKTMLRETYKFHDHLESVTLAAREKNEMYINRSTS